ncbi:HTH-type transcriptional regulator ZntR [BD1-7 clade bacterium]|uniref:HTH-type transcriptional regulator ZntR n=1 Tax=BD1-7 clade bacterium TaxID=2029982 RepID=A0A5S9QZC8_9GAMM|nr:HTH-type transcriptional regulator ZntR [BD1-7 clade bacterium]
MQSHYFRIGDIANQTGLSQDTLRYYEKQGLIQAQSRSASNYRLYDEQTLRQIHFIQRAKSAGFSLADIRQLLQVNTEKDQRSCQEVKNFTRHKLDEIENRIAELESMRATLSTLWRSCDGGLHAATACNILKSLSADQPIEKG